MSTGTCTTVIYKPPNDELLKCKPKVVFRCLWFNRVCLTTEYFGVKRFKFVPTSSLSYSSDNVGNVRVMQIRVSLSSKLGDIIAVLSKLSVDGNCSIKYHSHHYNQAWRLNDVSVKHEMWSIWFLSKLSSCKLNASTLKYVFISIFGDRLRFISKVTVTAVIFFNNLHCKLTFETVNWLCRDYNTWPIFYYDPYEHLPLYKISFKLNIWSLIQMFLLTMS